MAQEADIVPGLIARLQEASVESLREELSHALPYLEQHFRAEQEPDGLFDSLRQLAPRMDGRLRDLTAEHGVLLDETRSLLATVKACVRLRGAVEKICRATSGRTWQEVAERLARFGRWEFENYQEGVQ